MTEQEAWDFKTRVAFLLSAAVFFSVWAYCFFTYGFLLGFGLGWLPAYICAIVFAAVLVHWFDAIMLLAAVVFAGFVYIIVVDK